MKPIFVILILAVVVVMGCVVAGCIMFKRKSADPIPLTGGIGEAKYPSLGHVLGSVILWDDLAMDNPNIRKDLEDVPPHVLEQFQIVPAETIGDVLAAALLPKA